MSESWSLPSDNEKWRRAAVVLIWIASVATHQLIGVIGIPVLSSFLIFTLCSVAQAFSPSISQHIASVILTEIPGYPVQAIVGFILGFVLGGYWQRRIIVWVWVLPLILFCVALIIHPMDGSAAFGPFYSPEAHHHSTPSELLSWSILFIPSAAYALGAKLAKPRGAKTI